MLQLLLQYHLSIIRHAPAGGHTQRGFPFDFHLVHSGTGSSVLFGLIERLCKCLGIHGVHGGKIVDVGKEDDRLDHIGHGKAGLRQNGLEVCQTLCSLLLHGIGHLAGGRVYRDLAGNEHHIAQIDGLTVGADGGGCMGSRNDFHSSSPLL